METREAHLIRQKAYLKTPAGRGTSYRYWEKHYKPKLTPYQLEIIKIIEVGGRLVVYLNLTTKPYGWHAKLLAKSGRLVKQISMNIAELLTTGKKERTLDLISIDVIDKKITYGILERTQNHVKVKEKSEEAEQRERS